jgi:hypothetical protein
MEDGLLALRPVYSVTKLVKISIDMKFADPRVGCSYPGFNLMDHCVQCFEI